MWMLILSIPIEMQQVENGCILSDLHKTTCIIAISKSCGKNMDVCVK